MGTTGTGAPRVCKVASDEEPAVLVLYLDLGFLANLADVAIRFVQIVREIDVSGRPTPAASKPLETLKSLVSPESSDFGVHQEALSS